MELQDYADPPRQDFDVRPNASQAVAAARRARATLEADVDVPPTSRRPPSQQQLVFAGILAVVIVLSLIGMSYQLSGGMPRPVATPQPTAQPSSEPAAFSAPPTAAPATPHAPTPTTAPSRTPVLPSPVLAAPVAPQTGQGLTLAEQPAEPPAPTYLEVVAEQAPHCIRSCDGQAGPSGGEWVAVQPISEAQAEVILKQAPHKVR